MSSGENRRYPDRDRAGSISPLASRKRILDVLMSGNSGRNCTSTSLIPNWPRADCSLMLGLSRVVLCAPAARIGRGRSRVKVLAGQEQQPELADLDLVPPGQLRLLDALPVDVCAVEAAHIPDGEECALAVELRAPS